MAKLKKKKLLVGGAVAVLVAVAGVAMCMKGKKKSANYGGME